mgnify:CR=1 FL=1
MLKIPEKIMTELIRHAKDHLPSESCGYLAGENNEVKKLIKMTNMDDLPDHFTFDPKEQFAALKLARNEGLQLISVYHSHPSSAARPSEEDLKLLKDPNMIYVIVSLETPAGDVKAYQISGENQMSEVQVSKIN